MRKTVLGVAAALALAGALALWPSPESPKKNPAAGSTPSDSVAAAGARALSAESVLEIKPGVRRAEARNAGPAPRLAPAMQEYAQPRMHRALFERLRNATRRTGEEDWILGQLLAECAKLPGRKEGGWKLGGSGSRERFIAALSEKDPNRGRRIAAFDLMNADPCEGISGVESTEKDIRALYAQGAAQGDPKARASLVLADLKAAMRGPDGQLKWDPQALPRISAEQLEIARQALVSGDPYAMLEAQSVLTFPLANLSLRTGTAELPLDNGAFRSAITLAACELGYPCLPQDNRLLMNVCALSGLCDAHDYREYLFFYGQTPSTAQRTVEYLGAIGAARRGDWSYFTFHPGPSPLFAAYSSR